MFIIGERVNGMFSDIKKAIQSKDKKPVQKVALEQVKAGANALDINVGPATADKESAMVWLVEAVREVTDIALSVDTAKFSAMKAGFEAAGGSLILNSTKGDDRSMDQYLPLAKEHDALAIILCIDENGVPSNVEGRVEIAMKGLAKAMEYEIDIEKIVIDPIVLPANVAQDQTKKVMQAISEIRSLADPSPHIVVGLSNISQRCSNTGLIDRTFLAMCVANGMDMAITDPTDEELMNTMITAELLMNKSIYCDGFLEAYYT
ncbi:MAG: dihydropteroate synthase [Candidatus Latescibacteria bacterium]|jgi:5-methyltetrahydrofolate corrinoid/iron sulfur protein methyltransferase|nr:dihydropteroate synthase [Candidatus Latescibacterota bacterium]